MTRQDLLDLYRVNYPAYEVTDDPKAHDWKLRKLVSIVPYEGVIDDPHVRKGIVYILGALEDAAEIDAIIGAMENVHAVLPDGKPLELRISSYGGDVYLGQAIIAKINEVRRQGRKVHAHVVGYAYSAAFDILQACDLRTIEATGSLMTHEEQLFPESQLSSSEMVGMGEFSHKLEKLAFAQWADRTGRPVDYYVAQTDSKEWWMTAQEALGEGFVDEVLEIPDLPRSPATAPKKRRSRGGVEAEREAD